MAPLRQRPPSSMKELTGNLPLHSDEPDVTRRQVAEMLAVVADGEPELLDQLRAHFLRRLHRASNDFPATAGLRVTEAALSMAARLSNAVPAVTKSQGNR